MADKKPDKKPEKNQEKSNAYVDFIKGYYIPYTAYKDAKTRTDLKSLDELGKEDLNLAANAFPKKADIERASIFEERNLEAITLSVELGYRTSKKSLDDYVGKKLNDIIKDSPVKDVKMKLHYIGPHEKVGDEEIQALHKEIVEYHELLAQYQNRDLDDEEREKVSEKILDKLDKHYDETYADNKDVANTLKKLARVSDYVKVNRLAYSAKEKYTKFETKLGGKDKVVSYLADNYNAGDDAEREKFCAYLAGEAKRARSHEE